MHYFCCCFFLSKRCKKTKRKVKKKASANGENRGEYIITLDIQKSFAPVKSLIPG